MSETIQMRTTQESSGDYQVYATATVGGEQPVKGLAIHDDISGRLDSSYIEASFSSDGDVTLEPDKATSATIRFRSAGSPAVRHVYVSPQFLSNFGDFSFDGEDTDLDSLPSLGISGLAESSEEEYDSDKEERASAEEAADALLGTSDGSSEPDSDEPSSASENDSDESEDEETVEVSDEEVGIVE
jgi:hypothetical protein